MNNEEKILEMLTMLQSEMGTMRSEMDAMRSEMDARFARLEAVQSKQGAQLAEVQETVTRVAITQENIVLPRLETLVDGHKHLLNTLATKARVEEVAEEVSTIKSVVISHSERLAALERAQRA